MDAQDTSAALIHDHPFTPRTERDNRFGPYVTVDRNDRRAKMPNPHLCAVCRLAEAAHATTTREQAVS